MIASADDLTMANSLAVSDSFAGASTGSRLSSGIYFELLLHFDYETTVFPIRNVNPTTLVLNRSDMMGLF